MADSINSMTASTNSAMTATMNAASTLANTMQTEAEDPNFATNPANLLQMQQQMAQYQEIMGLASAIVSDIKQTAQSIIQKI